jgi:hypothetical protein
MLADLFRRCVLRLRHFVASLRMTRLSRAPHGKVVAALRMVKVVAALRMVKVVAALRMVKVVAALA